MNSHDNPCRAVCFLSVVLISFVIGCCVVCVFFFFLVVSFHPENLLPFSFLLARQTWELKSVMQKDSKSYQYIGGCWAKTKYCNISKAYEICADSFNSMFKRSFNFVIIGNFFTCISGTLFKFHRFFQKRLSQSVELTHVHIGTHQKRTALPDEKPCKVHERIVETFCSHIMICLNVTNGAQFGVAEKGMSLVTRCRWLWLKAACESFHTKSLRLAHARLDSNGWCAQQQSIMISTIDGSISFILARNCVFWQT